MGPQPRTVDQRIARLGSRAKGIVTHAELIAAGITAKEIRGRRARGSLLPVFRGVYRVGHAAPSIEATYMAAVKACGDGAVVSGLAAAHLLGIVRGAPPPSEVTTTKERSVPGIAVRQSRRLNARDRTRCRGIPVTSVPRTLVDLAAVVDEEALARACHEARVKYGTRPEHVEAALARKSTARGSAALRRVLRGDARVLLSKLEKGFIALLEARDLPLPETNKPKDGHFVDCRWPDYELTVELDSYRYHSTRHAWEEDRKREREAYARGDQFRRYTWRDVFEDPAQMLAELRALLPAKQRSVRT